MYSSTVPDFCGIVGDSDSGLDPLVRAMPTPKTKESGTYREGGVAVYWTSHPQFRKKQPACSEDGSLMWVHGTPYGYEASAGYKPRTDFSITDAEYCADLFDDHGIDFVEGLNGEFSGLVLDPNDREAYIFTDRLGSRPLFYTRTEDALLFSSRIQSIGLHPDVTPDFDRRYLAEFFSVQKAFGTATPLVDVRKVPPASILVADSGGSVRDRRTYWRPEYRPVDRSPATVATEIVDILKTVLEERLRNDLEYGVLLSGGSDSRLILGAMIELGYDPTAFHMTNWMSREARTAERVAITAGVEFRILRRDPDYHAQLLGMVPQFSNFVGAFDESIASGFAAELGSVDVVLTGYLGDTIFGEYPLYLPTARLVNPRVEQEVKSVSEFVDRYLDRYSTTAETPGFVDAPEVADVMRDNIRRKDTAIRHHGVEYPSLRELQLCEYYPLTNQFASANTDSVRRITGHWSPFFDKRLIDLSLSVPVRDRIRSDLINRAVTRLSQPLAAIPHSGTGIPLRHSTRTGIGHSLRKGINKLKRRFTGTQPPAPFVGHGPWMNEEEVIRDRGLVGDAIDRNRDLISSLDFLDGAGVDKCYRDHIEGANNWRSLYTLVTLLETPLADRVAADSR